MDLILQSALAFLFTIVLGSQIANRYQARSAKEHRFFEASNSAHRRMVAATEQLTELVGRRIYATQRVCLISENSENLIEARRCLKEVNIEWNNRLLSIELAVRTLFRHSRVHDFEILQNRLSSLTNEVLKNTTTQDPDARQKHFSKINKLRHDYFKFAQAMFEEANQLHRQMHFGVRVGYDEHNLDKLSSLNLFKLLFVGSEEGKSILLSPSDIGLPIDASDARLGIHK